MLPPTSWLGSVQIYKSSHSFNHYLKTVCLMHLTSNFDDHARLLKGSGTLLMSKLLLIVFSIAGGTEPIATTFYKRLASLVSEKLHQTYNADNTKCCTKKFIYPLFNAKFTTSYHINDSVIISSNSHCDMGITLSSGKLTTTWYHLKPSKPLGW